jgi:hypothetical protein
VSISWLNDVEPAPGVLVRPGGAVSLDEAGSAIELWEHYSGKRLDPAQRQTVEIIMATDAAGRWAASTTGRCEPRQNGKGDEIEVVELHGLVQRGEAILHTVHDAVLLASQAQQRMLSVLEGHPDLRRLVKRKWKGTGQQMIELHNGGTVWYRTRTGGGGRGVDDIDRLVVDEAQNAADEHLAALTPTMLANENAQLNALGSAGIEGKSAWWWQMRIRALGSDPGSLGFIEHTAETVRLDEFGAPIQDPIDASDRALWLKANPALHAGRGQGLAFFEEQFRRLDRRSFCREHLGVWDPPPFIAGPTVIPAGSWLRCGQPTSELVGRVVFTFDVTPDRRWGSIGAAGLSSLGAKVHLEVIDHREGTAWMVPRLVELRERWNPLGFWCDDYGPAGGLLSAAKAAGLEIGTVNTKEHAQACGGFLDGVVDEELVHTGQDVLDAAVSGADKRTIGDMAWLWSRKNSTVDISPLVAVTLAKWAWENAEQPEASAACW